MIDGGQRYWASQAMAPFDLDARAAAAARLAQHDVDVRVRQPSAAPWPPTGSASVSMRDLLGASIITYDQHLDLSDATTTASSPYLQEPPPALTPKAVYVQYQAHDPV